MSNQKTRGLVEIPLESLAKLLHLRAGLTVIGAEFKPEFETVRFFIEGDGLAPISKRMQILRYPLTELMDVE